MGFGTLTVTNAGVALKAKVLGGATLVFTKAKAGSGTLSAGQDPKTMTALVSAKQDISISSVTATLPNQLTVRIDFDNRALAVGYQWREIGLFAQDPIAGEILYAYCNAGDEGTYMPAGAEGYAEQIVDLITVISNIQDVTVQLDNTGVTPVWEDLRINGVIPCVGTGTNTIAVNNANITGYVDGMKITLDMGTSANTGAATININSMGAKAAMKQLSSGATGVLTGGETVGITEWQYKVSLSAFILLSAGPAVKTLQDGKLDKAGGTMTGSLMLASAPTADMQAANKAYVDSLLAANDAMVFKGTISASSNPNYPAADCGHAYKISTAGMIGGASGVNVEIGDMAVCTVDGTAAGTQAAVGNNWIIIQANVDGAVTGPASSVADRIPVFSGATGKVIKDGGYTIAELMAAIKLAEHPVGDIIINVSGTNPGTYIGGTWVAWGSGRVPVGVDTSQTEFNTVEKIGGEKTHALTSAEMPTHAHEQSQLGATLNGSSGSMGAVVVQGSNIIWMGTAAGTASGYTTANQGGGAAHNNLPPYVTCYMWKRTA